MMMVSSVSEKLAIHPGSDPLEGFHISSVFDGVTEANEKENRPKLVEAMVTIAKVQFHDWCKAFAKFVRANSVIVRFYYGDAITFCHEIASKDEKNTASHVATRFHTT